MGFFIVTIPGVLYRFAQLVGAPFVNPNVLWFAMPLIISIIVIELYFGRYKKEDLGWDAAVMNALVLIFTSLDLFQYSFGLQKGFFGTLGSTPFLVSLFVLFLGIGLFLLDFFHKLPRKLAFKISAHIPINLSAYTALVIVYNQIPIDLMTLIALFIMITVFALIFFFIRLLEPEGRSDRPELSSRKSDLSSSYKSSSSDVSEEKVQALLKKSSRR